MQKKIIFVMNSAKYFVLNRLNLAKAAKEAGYSVAVAVPEDDLESCEIIKLAGLELYPWSMSRQGLHPVKTLYSIYALYHIFRCAQPDIIHSLTIKPVVLSGLLANLSGIPMIALIPGRGIAFERRFLGPLAKFLYYLSLKNRDTKVCFQNKEDHVFFTENRLINNSQGFLIQGSGVDTERFSYSQYDENKTKRVVLCAARMLKEKGILEFIEAAKLVQNRSSNVEFRLAGDIDSGNPSSLDLDLIYRLCKEAQIDYLGHVKDMPKLLQETDIFCLPTSYPEGIPMTLLQAAACGNALITTNVPGCREVVIDQETGILLPSNHPTAIAEGIQKLLDSPELCSRLSMNCKTRLDTLFCQRIIHRKTLALYQRQLHHSQPLGGVRRV